MAREPLDAALAADLERLGHDAAAVAAGTWPTRKLTDGSLQFLRGRTLHAFLLKTHAEAVHAHNPSTRKKPWTWLIWESQLP